MPDAKRQDMGVLEENYALISWTCRSAVCFGALSLARPSSLAALRANEACMSRWRLSKNRMSSSTRQMRSMALWRADLVCKVIGTRRMISRMPASSSNKCAVSYLHKSNGFGASGSLARRCISREPARISSHSAFSCGVRRSGFWRFRPRLLFIYRLSKLNCDWKDGCGCSARRPPRKLNRTGTLIQACEEFTT